MNDDATGEYVDTSDTEERDILDAQMPGYYQRVWGKISHAPIEIDGEREFTRTPVLAQLEPRTPSHNNLLCSSDVDPSPVLSRLQISSRRSGVPAATTGTPATTPVDLTSNSPSTMPFSSPLGDFDAGYSHIKDNIGSPQLFAEGFELDNASHDPHTHSIKHVAARSRGVNYGKDNIAEVFSNITHTKDVAHDATAHITYDTPASNSRASSPPLEFPQSPSPSPDPLAFPPVFPQDGSESRVSSPNFRGSITFQIPDGTQKHASSIATGAPANNFCGTPLHTPDDLQDRRIAPGIDPFSLSILYPSDSPPAPVGLNKENFSGGPAPPHSFHSLPPTPPPLTQPSSRRISPTPSSSLSPAPPSPAANPARAPPSPPVLIPPDPNPRAYSLRNRSAMQLNPFEYEKRMYKRQLRGLPEAIVKDPTAAVGRGERERYRRGEEGWGNQSENNEDDDGDDKWRRRERQREKKKHREIVDEQMRELGIVMPSDDEEDVIQQLRAGRDTTGGDVDKRGKKRKRRVEAREFPMLVEAEASPLLRAPQNDVFIEPPSRPRPRPIFRGRSPTPGSSRSVHAPTPAPVRPIDLDLDVDFAADFSGPFDLGSQEKDTEEGGRSSPILIDDAETGIEPKRGRIRRSRGREGDDSDVQMVDNDESSSDGSSVVEMTDKDRKQLKAMQRMMPVAHLRKLLAQEQGKSKGKGKSREHQSEDSDKDRDDAPLQRGRGRKRIVSPGSKDPKRYEIRGDPESESEREDVLQSADQDVLVLEDSNSDGNDDALSLEDTEEEIDDGEIETWLALDVGGELDRDLAGPPSAPRMRRPDYERDRPRGGDLIDRMLQRTNRVGPRSSKPSRNPKLKSKARAPRSPKAGFVLDIVTREARRHGVGEGRQTKLAFPKTGKRRSTGPSGPGEPSVDQYKEHHVKPHEGAQEKKKKTKKHARGGVQTRLYVVDGHGRKVISGRERHIIHIDDDDDAFHEALAPAGPPRVGPRANNGRERPKNMKDILDKFRASNPGEEPDAFDAPADGGRKHSNVTLDFDIPLLPSGIRIGAEGYIAKGRLAHLVSVLNNEIEAPRPLAVTTFEQEIDPGLPVSQVSTLFAAACDHLYNASTADVDDAEMPLKMKASEVTMHTLCQLVSFRAWCADDQDGQLAAAVSEQTAHLVGRINDRLELVSADGHILDPRSFSLYWFAFELELRLAFARQKRKRAEDDPIVISTTVAERYAVLLLRRLLEYGLDRTLQPLQNLESQNLDVLDMMSPDVRTMELWACFSHLAPFFGKSEDLPSSSFWRIVEASMEVQSNKPDSSLDTSERMWRTMFGLCTISQFSVHGLTLSTVRLDPNWTLVSKALGSIRLGADEKLDQSKPASTLKKRDRYVRLVTARCLLLDVRYCWRLNDAGLVFRELCAIFRSRGFCNLLGEPSDFPMFIRERDEPLFLVYTDTDSAYGLFLKMIVRAARSFSDNDSAARTRKLALARLLGLAVPVSPMSFTKASPPIGQELSMLYNRYSAIFVAIYVDPTPMNIHSRLQQIRRYLNFKNADYDSQAASIRALMNLAILLRHLNQPLDDILAWASEMMKDLLENYSLVDNQLPGTQGVSQADKDQLVISIQLLLGSVRMVIENPALNRSEARPAKYPDLALLRHDWIRDILASPSLSTDHRTGIEIRKYVQSFLSARSKIIPPPPIPKAAVEQVESQDEYADAGIDMDDPAVLALLDSIQDSPDETYVAEKKAGEIMSFLAKTPICRLVFQYLGQVFNPQYPGNYFHEGDQWIGCWVGCASIAVRNREKDWTLHMKMWQAACGVIKNDFCRRRILMRFMLTMLQLDPASYSSHEDDLLQVWFETIVSPEITIEHDFNALLFSVGGLRHVLFRNFPCATDINTGMVTLEKAEFEQLRQAFIDIVICNIAENLEDGTRAERHISFLATMLNTLKDSLKAINLQVPNRAKYAELCGFVYASVRKHARLTATPTLQAALSWGDF